MASAVTSCMTSCVSMCAASIPHGAGLLAILSVLVTPAVAPTASDAVRFTAIVSVWVHGASVPCPCLRVALAALGNIERRCSHIGIDSDITGI